jgi:glyoxylase-like metal-dependent hydrolase (beta-lactamase superfamily II)
MHYCSTHRSTYSSQSQDPRQYVPAHGQTWTSLNASQDTQKNQFKTDEHDSRIHYITTAPLTPAELPPGLSDTTTTRKQLGIGERAILLQTEDGNVLWDLIAFLNQDTVDFINGKGGLKAIVISHPHFYTTHLEWATQFKCPVYVAADDAEWLSREDKHGSRISYTGAKQVSAGVTVVQCGGHFDGSSVLHWEKKLFIADTIMSVPVCLPTQAPRSRAQTDNHY